MSFRSKALSLLAGAALFLAACGGDDGGGGDEKVSSDDFASAICTAFGDWQSGIQERQSDLQAGLDPNATPTEGKEALASFLSAVNDDTDKLVDEVGDAGTPEAEEGEEIADALQSAAEGAQAALQTAEENLDDLPTDSDEAFKTAAEEFGTEVRTALTDVGEGLQEISSPELEKAFEEAETCNS